VGWEDRLTMMGMCFASSGGTDPGLAAQVAALRDSTMFALTARRWLAGYLGVEPTLDALSAARHAAMSLDPAGYIGALMADQHIANVIADEGYPQPTVTRAEFEADLGVRVHRVARIEPWIIELQALDLDFGDFEAGFERRLEEAAVDPHTVGFKSIIAYRCGLDFDPTRPSDHDVAERAGAWLREIGMTGRSRLTDPVLLRFGLWEGAATGLPLPCLPGPQTSAGEPGTRSLSPSHSRSR